MLWTARFDPELQQYIVECANGFRVTLSEARRHQGCMRATDEEKAAGVAAALNRLYIECPENEYPVQD